MEDDDPRETFPLLRCRLLLGFEDDNAGAYELPDADSPRLIRASRMAKFMPPIARASGRAARGEGTTVPTSEGPPCPVGTTEETGSSPQGAQP